ncbi:thiol reductase thioredoxin [Synechocystis salina LEGE 06099]|uniref:thioredoxin domain-containing protein n=1 Tax=Synechocystis salina TaxID=945780 RepID=UPI00187ECE42|nr:thioredoxin domain-containing protein [Synechocystis salina]MBE9203947.1 thiol reductase thioredoxin [Synechocystis salina LEGE 06099]
MAVKKQFANFADMLAGSPKPVLVDFYATWCGPCQMMAPILEQVGSHLRQQLQVVKIDTDRYPRSPPSTKSSLYQRWCYSSRGNRCSRIEGVQQAAQLIQQLQVFV